MGIQTYEEVWQTFITGDHVSIGTIWGGEGLALIVPVEQPELVGSIQRLQSKLISEIPFEPLPSETFHITINLFGNPSLKVIPELVRFLRDEITLVPKFEINLKGVNSFFRAPFLEVHDGGILSSITSILLPGSIKRKFSTFDYGTRGQTFHLTLGAYSEAGDGSIARQLLKQLRPFVAGKIVVDELRLVRTSAGKPYRLINVDTFPLCER